MKTKFHAFAGYLIFALIPLVVLALAYLAGAR